MLQLQLFNSAIDRLEAMPRRLPLLEYYQTLLNVHNLHKQEEMFPLHIMDWRKRWEYGTGLNPLDLKTVRLHVTEERQAAVKAAIRDPQYFVRQSAERRAEKRKRARSNRRLGVALNQSAHFVPTLPDKPHA